MHTYQSVNIFCVCACCSLTSRVFTAELFWITVWLCTVMLLLLLFSVRTSRSANCHCCSSYACKSLVCISLENKYDYYSRLMTLLPWAHVDWWQRLDSIQNSATGQTGRYPFALGMDKHEKSLGKEADCWIPLKMECRRTISSENRSFLNFLYNTMMHG